MAQHAMQPQAQQAPVAALTVGDVQAFSDTLDGLSDASRARKLSAVKSLLSFGHRIGYLAFEQRA